MLVIDGSQGEGGGQILRTALGLSLCTRTPFRIENVRAGRARPGLMRQHLTAVNAATKVGQARVVGAEIGSVSLEFHPSAIVAGEHVFNVGSAGSATLVFQTILPALLRADRPTHLVLEGGTHNPLAPSFDFLARVFAPCLRKMGATIELQLLRHGFYPAGGGRFTVRLEPSALSPLHLVERGEVRARRATALQVSVPGGVAERELAEVQARLGWEDRRFVSVESNGPGNVLSLEVESEHVTELFTSFGERGVRAEEVAARAIAEASAYLEAGVPVGAHLADQLLLPMALAGGGSFRTLAPTQHTRTQMEIIGRFLAVKMRCEQRTEEAWHVEVGS